MKKMGKSKGRMCLSGESHHFVQKWWMSGVQEVYASGYAGEAKCALMSLAA